MIQEINDQTPIALLTVCQLKQLLCEIQSNSTSQPTEQIAEPRMLYSIKQLAEFLQCSTVTAQKIKSSGRIPFAQTGRKVVFDGNAVMSALSHKMKGQRA